MKVIGDERRLVILRSLMSQAATLSQLGRALGAHPAKIRHHLKLLEDAGFVEQTETRIVGGFVEKYYQAIAKAFMVNLAIIPDVGGRKPILAFGSHDIALELLAEQSNQVDQQSMLVPLAVGSLDGLIALRQGMGQLAGCHLFDRVSGDFNRDYVRHIFPGQEMRLLTLTNRQQGLMVAKGNPKGIRSIEDLTREDVVFINRQPGSGTRLWLDIQLKEQGISPAEVEGYKRYANTHRKVGQIITRGEADVGIGLLAAARQLDLNFVPLFQERFDLVLPDNRIADPILQPMLNHLQSSRFRRSVRALGGYDTQHTGDMEGVT
jgi:putative molybdopterin biosynthesis protein